MTTIYEAANRHGVVMGVMGHYVCVNRGMGYQPYVTWSVGSDGSMNHGHYFKHLADAMADLQERYNNA